MGKEGMLDRGYFMGLNRKGVDKFQTPDPTRPIILPYDMPGELIQELKDNPKRGVTVVSLVLNKDTQGQLFNFSGFHIVPFGVNGALNKGISNGFYLGLQLERWDRNAQDFPLRNNRGWSGPFNKFYLSYPAQFDPNTADFVRLDLLIFKNSTYPWIGHETTT